MRVFERMLAPQLIKGAQNFGAVVLTGPRRAGKTFLLQHVFKKAAYYLLEDPDTLLRVKADPRGWLDEIRLPAIVDEVQNAPELFSYIRTRIDRKPQKKGQWILTGSRELSLMEGVSESMAGRAAVFQLCPLSMEETGDWNLVRGFFPEAVLKPGVRALWFKSYIQTYLERDVRSIKAVRDLSTFRRFLSLIAARNGQMLNRSELAGPLGISVPAVSEWINILEITGQILLIPPYFENFGKRLVKSPKIYWIDSGLLCHLLGIITLQQLENSPFLGSVFESFIASEIVKRQIHNGKAKELYYFRDEQGLEVDFILPEKKGRIELIEAKYTKTVTPSMAGPMKRLVSSIKGKRVSQTIIHRGTPGVQCFHTIAPGVRAVSVEQYFLQR